MAEHGLEFRREPGGHLAQHHRPPEAQQFHEVAPIGQVGPLVAAQVADPAGPLGRADQGLGAIDQLEGQHLKQFQGQQGHHGPADHGPQRFDVDQAGAAEALHHRQQPRPAPDRQQQGQVDPAAQEGIAPAQARQAPPQAQHPQADVQHEDALE